MEEIVKILTEKFGMNERTAKRNAAKLSKYDDIMQEFVSAIDGDFPEDGIIVENYSAKDIHNMTDLLNKVGVYNFMVTLRDDPDTAKEIIKSGFKVK